MSVREYIGARYIPLFMGQWDNTVAYEPLSIVEYQGDSYTSRQAVPIGIEISNTAFWALSGNYNAQIEQYRREVAGFNDRITTVENTVDDLLEIPYQYTFENVQAMQQYDLAIGEQCETLCYRTSEDNGGNTYIISDTGIADGGSVIALQNGLYAHATSDMSYVEKWGADNTGTIDSITAIQSCIDFNKGKAIEFQGGTFLVSEPILTFYKDNEKVDIIGNGSVITPTDDYTSLYIIGIGFKDYEAEQNVAGTNFAKIYNLTINGKNMNLTGIVTKAGYKDCRIIDCEFYYCKQSIQIGDDTGYPADASITGCILRGIGVSNFGAGIILNGTDNKISNCRIYGHAPCFEQNGGGSFIDNVHSLANQGTKSAHDIAEWEKTIFAKVNAGSIFISSCYVDSLHGIIDGVGGKCTFVDSEFNMNFEGASYSLFEFTGTPSLTITNNYFIVPDDTANVKRLGLTLKGTDVHAIRHNNLFIGCNFLSAGFAYLTNPKTDLIRMENATYNISSSMSADEWYCIGSIPLGVSGFQVCEVELNIGQGFAIIPFMATYDSTNHVYNAASISNMISNVPNYGRYTVGIGFAKSNDDSSVWNALICIKSNTAVSGLISALKNNSGFQNGNVIPYQFGAGTVLQKYTGNVYAQTALTA